MKNILHTQLGIDALTECLRAQRHTELLPPVGSPVWRETFAKPTVQQWMIPIRALVERERREPLPVLTDELYADFCKTGTRRRFENVYFGRRQRLARAALGALEEGRVTESLVMKLTDVFAEVSWALPAHTGDPSGKEPLLIDLFTAETANLLAEMLTVFGPELPVELVQRIQARLRTDIFENYLAHQFAWTTFGMNWNAVCHQGVLGAALAVETDDALVARMLARVSKHLPAYLRGFTPDGGCSEGPAYWQYGFGCFAELNRQLETRTGGALSLVAGDQHIREIVKYGSRLSLRNGRTVTFSDCLPTLLLRPDLLDYLGERFDDCAARELAQVNYRILAVSGYDTHAERQEFFHLARLFLRCPADLTQPVAWHAPEVLLPDLGLLIARGTDRQGHHWEFAAKAGHNGEHHNHNDCGSFIVNVDGEPLVVEIGTPEYVKDFFSDRRYEFLAARTRGHSLPIINGCEQAAGREHAARVLTCVLSDKEAEFVVDLTACYPQQAGCNRYVRSFHFGKEHGRLDVHDEFELRETKSLETAVIARVDRMPVVTPVANTVLVEVQTHAYRSRDGADSTVQRIVLQPQHLRQRTTLHYTLTQGNHASH